MMHLVLCALPFFMKTALSETADNLNWIPFQSKMYHFPSSLESPLNALVYCESIVPKGKLAVLSDPNIRKFLLQEIPQPPALTPPYKYHIGLLQVNSSFSWIDGSKYRKEFAWWAPGEPKEIKHLVNYVSMGSEDHYDPNFLWRINAGEWKKAHYICERPNVDFDLKTANTREASSHAHGVHDRVAHRFRHSNMAVAALQQSADNNPDNRNGNSLTTTPNNGKPQAEQQASAGFSLFGFSTLASTFMLLAALTSIFGAVAITILIVKIRAIPTPTRSENRLSLDSMVEERRQSANEEFQSSKEQFQNSKEQFQSSKAQFQSSKAQFQSSNAQFQSSNAQFQSSKAQFQSSKAQFQSSKAEFQSSKAEFNAIDMDLPEELPPSDPELNFYDTVTFREDEELNSSFRSTSEFPGGMTGHHPRQSEKHSTIAAVGTSIAHGISAVVPTAVSKRLSSLSVSIAASIRGSDPPTTGLNPDDPTDSSQNDA